MDANNNGLHSLLFDEGRQLENIKFFPGTKRGLTGVELCSAADIALRAALESGPVDCAPVSGRKKATI